MTAHKRVAAVADGPHLHPDRPGLMAAVAGRIIAAVRRRWQDHHTRRLEESLDYLDDWILKDVGLWREHLPDGTTRVVRRQAFGRHEVR